MQNKFHEDFPKFKTKIHNFITTQNFKAKHDEYEKLFDQMVSIPLDDMKETIDKEPKFLTIRNQTLKIMERLVEIYRELDELFKMEEVELGLKFKYDLSQVDQHIGALLKESGGLAFHYDELSEQGRAIVENLNSPFFKQ